MVAGRRGKPASIVESMEIVERPLSIREKWPLDEEIRELLKTVDSGKAIRLRISSQADVHKIHMALRYAINRKAKKQLHYKMNDDRTITAWAEKEKVR